ncbi:MAG: hypothetical protein HQK77_09170 [Desulfobacterales bacterium]|nr:hypothetical protein [Desulfobacterales bacterium]
MADNTRRERDLILAPNEHAYILDETKGNIVNYVGPHKTSLANTDQPVVFNATTKRFERCNLEQAIQPFGIAPEGWYVMLKNPAKDGKPPTPGTANSLPPLDIGKKVNIPGPVSFAPWPGQMIRVIQGHHLRSNQYLIVRVYDEDGAKANWGKAVIKKAIISDPQATPIELDIKPEDAAQELTMGKLLVIKGTGVSFYIPPTGIEVVPDKTGRYIQDAVTLERLEYCTLLDESGNKRYIIGPDVVFPEPTETFVEKNGLRKFRAIELNEISGLYVKVIAPYSEDGKEYKIGEELFITGKDQMIYFPRPEHAIIRYSDKEVNYAVAIPAGEARYVLNRTTGQITLKRGPCMFLPDPRKEVIARRVIEPKLIELWFPGNTEALEYNQRLMSLIRKEKGEFVMDDDVRQMYQEESKVAKLASGKRTEGEFVGDAFNRKQSFSQPRTITLDTKYEGAVGINVWTGYAVLVISKLGERKVVVGPQTYLLEYDETLHVTELSTGTPKAETRLFKTVYLRVLNNKISDIVTAETRDLCEVNILVSYRVNFDGDPIKWFNVENYVKFLTDHMRSRLRHEIRQHGIETFYMNAIRIVRDTVLGIPTETSKRPGAFFEENNMRIYDVEVLSVDIENESISNLLVDAQHTTVQQTLEISAERKKLEVIQQKEDIKQQISKAEALTQVLATSLQTEQVNQQSTLNMARLNAEFQIKNKDLDNKLSDQKTLDAIHISELDRKQKSNDLELTYEQQRLNQRIQELKSHVEAIVNKAGAISPQLISALQAFSDKALAEKMAQSMSPLAIMGGKSIADVFSQLVKGTILEQVLDKQEN